MEINPSKLKRLWHKIFGKKKPKPLIEFETDPLKIALNEKRRSEMTEILKSKISDHISYNEAVKSVTATKLGINNEPDARQLKVMEWLADHIFEPTREGLGNYPLVINSFYRSQKLNIAVGGASKSDHMILGDTAAIDLDNDQIERITGVSNTDIFYFIYDNLDYYKLIWEFGDENKPAWVHVSYSIDPEKNRRKQTYRAVRKSGKVNYVLFTDKRK